VHGYRSRDSRNNIGIVQDKTIVYHAAGLGIGYDPAAHKQRFFKMHNDDVTAIAFSPNKTLIATGEIGAKPIICLWDAITLQPKFILKNKLTKGIQSLSFSNTGKTLAAVAVDDNHTVAVYNVETGTCMGTASGDTRQILDITMKDDMVFATSGIQHFKEWTIE
jgi:WD40 repeat protein